MKKTNRSLLISAMSLLLCLSMLVGSTFAWFTDEATAGVNQILAGELDVGMDYWNGTAWVSVEGESLFPEDALWEPGHTEVVYLRISNLGNLALKYRLGVTIAEETGSTNVLGETFTLSQYMHFGAVEAQPTFASRDAALAALSESQPLTAGYTKTGSIAANEGAQYVALVVYMPKSVGNEANHMAGVAAPTIKLGIDLIATQAIGESDSFGNNYDANAAADFFPGFQGGSAGATVNTNDQGVTTADVDMAGGDVSAVIPAGVLLANGVDSLELSVAVKDASEANIQLSESEKMSPLDVHIEGVGAGNTVPMLITLEQYLTTGINTGALRLYHVENGTSVAMTQVANPTNHNEFSYDPLTGNLTLALASFSEVAVVADTTNTWNGTAATAFAGGNGTEANPYQIANADQLAYFRNEVDGGRTFDNEYVKLSSNIYLSNVNFDPIGWGYVNSGWNRKDADGEPMEGKVFQGTFDGNNKIIFDLYQNGWDLEAEDPENRDYTYTNCGFGLFAAAADATFKNLTIYGAYVRVECVETGILVGLSQGSCIYDNISIQHSKAANYQRPVGGLIGEVSPLNGGVTEITDVEIGADVVVGSLWGDFDAPCGGVIGARWDDSNTTKVNMTRVKVHCQLDVYSDVTSAYQWYAYRRAGMLIGNTELTDPDNQHLAYAKSFLTCKDVEVCYGDWVNYTYYQFTNQENTWCNNYPWVRAEVGENCSAFSNPRYGQPVVSGGITITSTNLAEKHKTGYVEIPFGQLYGGGQGVYGQSKHEGVTVPECRYTITYINDGKVLSTKYVTEEVETSTKNAPAQHLVELWGKDHIKEYDWRFGGWMTAASAVITDVPADNAEDIVLYPYYQGVYTATFVNQAGEILAWELFAEGATALKNTPEGPKVDDFTFDHWEIRHYYEDGTFDSYGELKETNLKNVKCDITLYPYYKYDGDVRLIPVDSDADGATNYYQVGGFGSHGPITLVEIPNDVNGVPVTEINADAFSDYDDLHSVRIPANITALNYQSFTADQGKRDTVTLYYEGDPVAWNSAMTDYNNRTFREDSLLKEGWDNYMGESSCVFFLDANGKVDLSKGYWELAKVGGFFGIGSSFEWQYHNHAYGSNSGCRNEHNNKTDYTANCKCDLGTHARPDAKYWN